MINVSVKEASDKLPDLVENTIAKREPVLISGSNNNAVLIAESDWLAMTETLHLLSVPGMRNAIQSGLSENLEGTSKDVEVVVRLLNQPIEAKAKPVQELKCSDVGVLWVGNFRNFQKP